MPSRIDDKYRTHGFPSRLQTLEKQKSVTHNLTEFSLANVCQQRLSGSSLTISFHEKSSLKCL